RRVPVNARTVRTRERSERLLVLQEGPPIQLQLAGSRFVRVPVHFEQQRFDQLRAPVAQLAVPLLDLVSKAQQSSHVRPRRKLARTSARTRIERLIGRIRRRRWRVRFGACVRPWRVGLWGRRTPPRSLELGRRRRALRAL